MTAIGTVWQSWCAARRKVLRAQGEEVRLESVRTPSSSRIASPERAAFLSHPRRRSPTTFRFHFTFISPPPLTTHHSPNTQVLLSHLFNLFFNRFTWEGERCPGSMPFPRPLRIVRGVATLCCELVCRPVRRQSAFQFGGGTATKSTACP